MGTLSKEAYRQIRQLHGETHAGMLYCRRALECFEYDHDKALEYLTSEKFRERKYHGKGI